MRDWRVWAMSVAILATSGVGAGALRATGGYLPLRVISAILAVGILISIGWRAVALATRNVPVVLFSVWSLLTLLWSTDSISTLTSLVGMAAVAILAVVMTCVGRTVSVYSLVMWLFTATSVLSALLALLVPSIGAVIVHHPTEGTLIQPIGLFIWNSDLGFSAAIAAVLAIGLAFRSRSWWLLAVAAIDLVVVWYSNSAMSMIVVVIGLLVVIVLQGRRIALITGGVVVVVVAVAGVVGGFTSLYARALALLHRSASLTGRVGLWRETLRQSSDRLLIGHGAGVEPDLSRITSAIHSHNGFIQLIFDRGIIGLLLMLLLMVLVIVHAVRNRDHMAVAVMAMIIIANLGNDYLTFASLGLTLLFWQSYSHLPGEFARQRGGTQTSGTRRLWVSAEIREELHDMLKMIERSGVKFREIRVDAPRAVLATAGLPSSIGSARVVPAPYGHAVGVRSGAKAWGLLQFASRVSLRPADIIFSGFSMLKHRTVSAWQEVRHVAYIRGVVFDPEIEVGLSDAASKRQVARIVPRRVFATYWADVVLTIGDLSRTFLIGRGLPSDRISVVGPVWLAPEELSRQESSSLTGPARAIFLTGAWEAHGLADEHEAQLRITRRLASEWRLDKQLVIRVHPRDRYDYSADPAFEGVVLDRSLPLDFLVGLRDEDVVIAPLSTLAFEAQYLDRNVVFYSDPVATKSYIHVYGRLGIVPRDVDSLLAGDLTPSAKPEVAIFAPIDYSRLASALSPTSRD